MGAAGRCDAGGWERGVRVAKLLRVRRDTESAERYGPPARAAAPPAVKAVKDDSLATMHAAGQRGVERERCRRRGHSRRGGGSRARGGARHAVIIAAALGLLLLS